MLQPTPREPLSTFLERLPKKVLISFAKKYGVGLKGDLSDQEELRSQILEKVPKSVILQQLYAPYGWAGNVTIYLYLFKDIKAELEEVSLRKRLESALDNINSKQKLTTKPKPVEVILPDKENNEIRVRHEFLGEPIIYQDPQTYELKTVNPLMTIFSVVHLPNGFTEIRAREKKNANEAIEQLKEYFHFQGKFEPLSFAREHLMQWIDWATTLRNARFKPEGPISTLYMGAKSWLDLRDVKLFKEWWEKGEPLEGIYIKFEIKPEEEVGFGINATMGKIMFRTFATEEEINFVIKEARLILGL